MPKIAFLFIIFLSISKALLADAQPVTLQDNNDYYEIGLNLNILEDPTGKLKIEDVNSPKYQKKFKKSQDKIPNFGFSTSSFWIKIIVNNKSQKKDWLFSYNYYNQDKITFFKKIGNAWEQKTTGDIYTLKTREREERPFVFKVSPKEKTTYFFRIEGTDHQANISLVTEEKFQKLKIKEYIYFSIFSGLVLGLILYNFFIFVSTKSKSYLYYILYLIFFWFFLSLDMGFAQLLFFEKHPWFSNGGIAFFACGACLFGLLFATSYLKIETDLLLFKVLSWGSIFCLVSTLIALIIPFFFSLKIMILNTLFVPITALYAGFYKVKKNYRPAKYFLIAFSTFIFGVIIYTLMIIDLLPNYPFIRNILPFSYSVEIILLSFGLADSFNLIQEEALKNEEKMRKFQQNYAKNLEKEVEERTKEIEEQKNNISNLLNYMSQSVFTINAGGFIQSKALSKHSNKIFEKDIANCSIYDVLYPDIDKNSENYSLIVFAISSTFGNDILQWDLNKNDIPNKSIIKTSRGQRFLDIKTDAIYNSNDNICTEILFSVTDVTEKLALEAEIKKREEEDSKRNRLLRELAPEEGKDIQRHSREVQNLLSSSRRLIDEVKDILGLFLKEKKIFSEDSFNSIWRNIHTLKGDARAYGLSLLSEICHHKETKLLVIKDDFKSFNVVKGAEILSDVQAIEDVFFWYVEVAKNVFSITIEEEAVKEQEAFFVHKNLMDEFEINISAVLKEPSKENLERLSHCKEKLSKKPLKYMLNNLKMIVSQTSKDVNKNVTYDVVSEDIYLEERKIDLLRDSLVHLLRNSVDHGIEEVNLRTERNKKSSGVIKANCKKINGDIVISIKDDGNGINQNIIAQKCLEKNIITEEEMGHLDDRDKLRLIFRPGFSTKDNTTEISGRGVGMDVVYSNIQKMAGTIEIETKEGLGTEFIIKLSP